MNRQYQIDRYPPSGNHTLQAGSAADEHVLRYLEECGQSISAPIICHDRFGALTTPLYQYSPVTIIEQKSQEISIRKNLERNSIPSERNRHATPLDLITPGISTALVRIPKSLDLYRFYLEQLLSGLDKDGQVICGFMTRHFTPQMLSIAEELFGSVVQSKAWKKSRLLILADPRPVKRENDPITGFNDDNFHIRQYPGVFSAQRLDTATHLLIQNINLRVNDRRILDLGCGNGVVGLAVNRMAPETEIHLMDNSWLAVESAKLNFPAKAAVFHWSDTVNFSDAGYFDLVLSNPPFHFEYEIDLSVPLGLFRETRRILKPGGVFQLVANRHLNYRTHLNRLFDRVTLIASDKKYEVLRCE